MICVGLDDRPAHLDVVVVDGCHLALSAAAAEAGLGWVDESGAAEGSRSRVSSSPDRAARIEGVGAPRWTPSVIGTAEALLLGTRPTVAEVERRTGLSTARRRRRLHSDNTRPSPSGASGTGIGSEAATARPCWMRTRGSDRRRSTALTPCRCSRRSRRRARQARRGRGMQRRGLGRHRSGCSARCSGRTSPRWSALDVFVATPTPATLDAVAERSALEPFEGGRLLYAGHPTAVCTGGGIRVARGRALRRPPRVRGAGRGGGRAPAGGDRPWLRPGALARRAASQSALVRVVHHYGARPEFVVLGGLVPEMLCAGSAWRHAGTTDVDVQVDLEIACGAVNTAARDRATERRVRAGHREGLAMGGRRSPAKTVVKFELLADLETEPNEATVRFDACEPRRGQPAGVPGFASRDVEVRTLSEGRRRRADGRGQRVRPRRLPSRQARRRGPAGRRRTGTTSPSCYSTTIGVDLDKRPRPCGTDSTPTSSVRFAIASHLLTGRPGPEGLRRTDAPGPSGSRPRDNRRRRSAGCRGVPSPALRGRDGRPRSDPNPE